MNALPHSPYRRAEVEWQEEARDDRSDRVKLEDACRLSIDAAARRDALIAPGVSVIDAQAFKEADQAADRAFSHLVRLINDQFGDEVDVELLAKALVS